MRLTKLGVFRMERKQRKKRRGLVLISVIG